MTNKELEIKVNELTALVASVVGKLPKVEPSIPLENKIENVLGGQSDPVPHDYRVAVDELLNKDFGIHVKASTGLPTFKFTVLVPKKYSKEPEYDVRPRVITYAEGLSAVKDWCERVLSTFEPGLKQQIISGRTLIT